MVIGGKSRLTATEFPMGAPRVPAGFHVDGVAHRQVVTNLAGNAQRIQDRHRGAVECSGTVEARAVESTDHPASSGA